MKKRYLISFFSSELGAGSSENIKQLRTPNSKLQIFVLVAFLTVPTVIHAQTTAQGLTPSELECLGRLIYFNECSGRSERLIAWNEDEDFPSLGIGHFIWYPNGRQGRFKESFPELIAFLKTSGVETPDWIEEGLPWQSREEFMANQQSDQMIALRSLLENTRSLQTQFMVERMRSALPKMLAAAPADERVFIKKKFYLIEDTPSGIFAMIDYVNFKGEGISITERLKGEGWGLLQVLQEMTIPKDNEDALPEFVRAAERVLEKRVENAASSKDETRWLKGWKNRVSRYLDISCVDPSASPALT